jgi:hypothetical protein
VIVLSADSLPSRMRLLLDAGVRPCWACVATESTAVYARAIAPIRKPETLSNLPCQHI